MPPAINIASVVSVELEGVSGLFVVDHYSGRVRRLSAEESDPVEAGRVMMAIRGRMRETLPAIPYGEISEVMRAERDVTESAQKSAEERDNDARG